MGLHVFAEMGGEELDCIYVGSYSRFARFREELVLALKGAQALQEYRYEIYVVQRTPPGGYSPECLAVAHSYHPPPSHPTPVEEPLVDEVMDIFLYHSDCDGDFSRAQCRKLAKAFRQHQKTFAEALPPAELPQDTHGLWNFLSLYDDFTRLFSLVAKTGDRLRFF
jgi:hypothetical protein